MSMQNARESPLKRAVSGQFGAFFMSLRAAVCAVHNLCGQAPLTLRGICNGERWRHVICAILML